MAIRRTVTDPGIYFITFTNYQWLLLIEKTNGYDLVYNCPPVPVRTGFDVLSEKNHAINGFVIMPNHLHLLLHYAGGDQSLNTIVDNGKRFIAYELVKRLERLDEQALLLTLKSGVCTKDNNRGKKHEVWERSFDAKECRTEKFVLQKLHYIHNNPCSKRWRLAKSPIDYAHSSARFYICGKHAGYPVRDYREFLKFDWQE